MSKLSYQTIDNIGFFFKKNLETKNLLVFLHSAGFSATLFTDYLEQLPQTISAIAIDLPGREKSTEPAYASITDLANHLHYFLQNFSGFNLIPCGHSMGGAITLQLLMDHPTDYSQAILMNTGARLKVLPQIFHIIQQDFANYPTLIGKFLLGVNHQTEDHLKKLASTVVDSASTALQDFTACNTFDVMQKLVSIKQQVLIISGENDNVTPKKYSDYLKSQLCNSSQVCIPNTGHVIPLEAPEASLKEILNFINSHEC